ncbi:MAG TPA: DUF222 domain-containing protein [Acidimicrobiales bacterium]|nr:DUF222 domain-containing protein [Acidimicrobiales bacterium]
MLVDVDAGCSAFAELLDSWPPEVFSGEECAVVAELLAAAAKRCAARTALFAARAADCQAYRGRGYSNARVWLADKAGISWGQAGAALDTVGRLDSCPETKEAVLTGEVSLAQATEITCTEAVSPGCEADLLNQAVSVSLNRLREICRRRRLEAEDVEEAHRRRRAARSARHHQDDEGMTRLVAAWPTETGVAVANRIDAEVDALLRSRRDAVPAGGDPEPIEALRADALAGLILGTGVTSGRRLGRPELVLVCDVAAFQRGDAQPGEVCHVIGGAPVPVAVARDLAQAAFIKAVLHDGRRIEQVAHYGSRYQPAELKTALGLGDPSLFEGVACVDCGMRYGIEWDHLDPFSHGGATSYDNLGARCRPCHWRKTQHDRAAGLLTTPRQRPPSATADGAGAPGPDSMAEPPAAREACAASGDSAPGGAMRRPGTAGLRTSLAEDQLVAMT